MRRARVPDRRHVRGLRRSARLRVGDRALAAADRRLPRGHLLAPSTWSTRASFRRSSSARSSTGCCRSNRPSDADEGIPGNQFIFEPNPDAVLRQLLPRYVATRVYQAVLELTASEQSARMVAMKNATENAQELIEDLTLTYNKVRQTNITREMIEIATGAQASERTGGTIRHHGCSRTRQPDA